MKITVIHGQSHKGITYTMSHKLLEYLVNDKDEVREFFYLRMVQTSVMDVIHAF